MGAPGSVYEEVGYAGQVWWTYDLGCGPGGARDPAAATDTWLGNQVFNVAKLVVGGVNWAHYLIARGSEPAHAARLRDPDRDAGHVPRPCSPRGSGSP